MRNIKKVACRLILIFLVLFVLEEAVEFLYRDYDGHLIYSTRELKESQGKIDTLFLGTSTAARGFSPDIFDEKMGGYSFNLATSAQPVSGTLQLLKEQAETNPVKTVILGISPAALKKEDTSLEAQTEVYDKLFSPISKLSYLVKECDTEDWLYLNFYSVRVKKYFDLAKVKENVTYKLSEAYKENQSPREYYKGRGFLVKDQIYEGKSYQKIQKKQNNWQVNPEREEEFLEIIEFCKKEKIELILVYIPVSGVEIKKNKDISVIHDYFEKLATEQNVEFWDFNYYVNLKEEFSNQMFEDKKHLNRAGGEYFCQLFTEVYEKYQAGENIKEYFLEECPYYQ